jgi:hypothetical protein
MQRSGNVLYVDDSDSDSHLHVALLGWSRSMQREIKGQIFRFSGIYLAWWDVGLVNSPRSIGSLLYTVDCITRDLAEHGTLCRIQLLG